MGSRGPAIDTHVHVGSFSALEEVPADEMRTKEDIVAFRTRRPDVFARQLTDPPVDNTETLIESMDAHGINRSMVMARAGIENEFVADMAGRHPHRLVPLLRLASDQQLHGYLEDPCTVRRSAPKEIVRCIEQYGMRGVGEVFVRGLTTEIHPERIADDLGPIMRTLADYGAPIAFPTGWSQWKGGVYYSDPLWTDEVAGRHPDVPVILSKMGRGFSAFFENALMVAVRNENVFFDMTHTHSAHLRQAVDRIGAERIMFGTDWSATWRYLQAPHDVHSLAFSILGDAGLTPTEEEAILSGTAKRLFRLEDEWA